MNKQNSICLSHEMSRKIVLRCNLSRGFRVIDYPRKLVPLNSDCLLVHPVRATKSLTPNKKKHQLKSKLHWLCNRSPRVHAKEICPRLTIQYILRSPDLLPRHRGTSPCVLSPLVTRPLNHIFYLCQSKRYDTKTSQNYLNKNESLKNIKKGSFIQRCYAAIDIIAALPQSGFKRSCLCFFLISDNVSSCKELFDKSRYVLIGSLTFVFWTIICISFTESFWN